MFSGYRWTAPGSEVIIEDGSGSSSSCKSSSFRYLSRSWFHYPHRSFDVSREGGEASRKITLDHPITSKFQQQIRSIESGLPKPEVKKPGKDAIDAISLNLSGPKHDLESSQWQRLFSSIITPHKDFIFIFYIPVSHLRICPLATFSLWLVEPVPVHWFFPLVIDASRSKLLRSPPVGILYSVQPTWRDIYYVIPFRPKQSRLSGRTAYSFDTHPPLDRFHSRTFLSAMGICNITSYRIFF